MQVVIIICKQAQRGKVMCLRTHSEEAVNGGRELRQAESRAQAFPALELSTGLPLRGCSFAFSVHLSHLTTIHRGDPGEADQGAETRQEQVIPIQAPGWSP